jgi:hypothetical protein
MIGDACADDAAADDERFNCPHVCAIRLQNSMCERARYFYGLHREDMLRMFEAFEFERVSAEVPEKHRRLFARLSTVTNLWGDDEFNVRRAHSFGQAIKFIPRENATEVRNRHTDFINLPAIDWRRDNVVHMRRDLIAEEIKVNPCCGAATFAAT